MPTQLLHFNQRQPLQLHQAASPNTTTGCDLRLSAARTPGNFGEASSRESGGATGSTATVVVASADIGEGESSQEFWKIWLESRLTI